MDWEYLFQLLRSSVHEISQPSLNNLTTAGASPFQILVSTILSLRTKDEVTLKASLNLFKTANTPLEITKLKEDELAQLIYPAGFYRTKAKQLIKISQILLDQHSGQVPQNKEELLALPGVGLKTANLVLGLAFHIDAICVDTHVHRISNRLGIITTKNADESEQTLSSILPKQYWIEINKLMVSFGQKQCTPISPYCSTCLLTDLCLKKNVVTNR